MTVPKPILVTALIMAAVAVPGQQAVPGKPEAPANQGVSAKSVQEFRQAHPDALVVECVVTSPAENGKLADSNVHSTSKTAMCGSIRG